MIHREEINITNMHVMEERDYQLESMREANEYMKSS